MFSGCDPVTENHWSDRCSVGVIQSQKTTRVDDNVQTDVIVGSTISSREREGRDLELQERVSAREKDATRKNTRPSECLSDSQERENEIVSDCLLNCVRLLSPGHFDLDRYRWVLEKQKDNNN